MDPIYQAHPVPQNISSFEFHLVGDMTLKQFAYLAIGLALAYLTFILAVASHPFLAWPIIIVSVALGTAFAFLPIAERPLDHWLSAFFKAIYHPTTRTFRSPSLKRDDQQFTSRLALYLNTPSKPLPASEQFTATTPPSAPAPSVSGPEQPLPSEKELEKTVELAKEAQDVQDKITATEQNIAQIKAQAAGVGADPKAFTERFQQILANLQRLNQEASTVSQQLAIVAQEPVKSPPVPLPIKPKLALTLALTTVANILNGIVTDIQGNYLESAIIVAHDKHGLPVRALKTNKLGQFIAATPLPNGIYTLTIEKDDLNFDRIQLDLKGQVLKPLLISARKQEIISHG